ncbi:MAG TPA: LamG-like jellyroll fold domain-containing protein, partial [Methylomirabilota bacterium]|nr:LamG-like jellyroll fold domain-containing protein [Methylomirabilota bacterium]
MLAASVAAQDVPPPPANQVLQLDGTNSFVEMPAGAFTNVTELTVEGWVKWESFRAMSRFFDFRFAGFTFIVMNRDINPDLFVETLRGDERTAMLVPGMLSPGRWTHVAATAGKDGLKLFVDGRRVEAEVTRVQFPTAGLEQRNLLGRSNFKAVYAGDADFHGQMDEVRVWNVERTEAQIREAMFQKLTGREPGLVGQWNFDDGTVNDSSAAAHHGQLIGQAKVVEAALPTAGSVIPWSRVFITLTDLAGTPLPHVTVRAEVKGLEVGRATSNPQGVAPLTVRTASPTVDLVASGTNDFGGWQFSVPVTPHTGRTHVWRLGRMTHIAGRAVALDGRTPHGGLVVELVEPDDDQTQSEEAPAESQNDGQRLLTSATTNRVLQLDGNNSYVELPPGFCAGLPAATVEGWVRWDRFRGQSHFFEFGGLPRETLYMANSESAGLELFSRNSVKISTLRGTGRLGTHQWGHVAVVWTSDGMKLYLNGALVGEDAFGIHVPSVLTTNDLNFLGACIGKARGGGAPDLHGAMDEVRVWNVERTAEEIRDHMSIQLTGREPGLIGLWNFDDPIHPGKDSSTNGLHGKLIGQALAVPEKLPILVTGRITDASGRALTDAYVEVRPRDGRTIRAPANADGDYALAVAPGENCDWYATDGELSAYRLDFQATAGAQQQLDWVLTDPEKTLVVLGGGSQLEPAPDSPPNSSQSLLAAAATNFPPGTVVATVRTDEQGHFEFPSVKPGRYQIRAQ